MKNVRTFRHFSARHITSNRALPLSQKLTKRPLPPKKADVVQKLQPIGQPTEGMIVAAGSPPPAGALSPSSRIPNDDSIIGCVIGASDGSPRNSRIQRMPSPLAM